MNEDGFYFITILSIIILVLSLIVFFRVLQIDLNPVPQPRHLIQEVTIEKFTMENIEKLKLQPAESFCKSYLGNSAGLEMACNELTENNCASVSCCVFNNKKCVAGNSLGPLYKTNKGKEIEIDHYNYLGQCYGNC